MGINEGLKFDSYGQIHKDIAFKIYSIIQNVIEIYFRYLGDIFIIIRNSNEYISMSILLNGDGIKNYLYKDEFIKINSDSSTLYNIYEEDSDNIQISMKGKI